MILNESGAVNLEYSTTELSNFSIVADIREKKIKITTFSFCQRFTLFIGENSYIYMLISQSFTVIDKRRVFIFEIMNMTEYSRYIFIAWNISEKLHTREKEKKENKHIYICIYATWLVREITCSLLENEKKPTILVNNKYAAKSIAAYTFTLFIT
jgi:hypothetical protein